VSFLHGAGCVVTYAEALDLWTFAGWFTFLHFCRVSADRKWLVFYTQSRQEKKVADYLAKRGVEVFLPLQQVLRQWSDRKKKVAVPLFPSYLFVHDTEDRIPFLLQTPGMAWNIRHNDRPAIVRPAEIAAIQRFLATGLLLEAGPTNAFEKGDEVEVVDGPLRGLQGTLARGTADGFVVELSSIGQSMKVHVVPEMLRKI